MKQGYTIQQCLEQVQNLCDIQNGSLLKNYQLRSVISKGSQRKENE